MTPLFSYGVTTMMNKRKPSREQCKWPQRITDKEVPIKKTGEQNHVLIRRTPILYIVNMVIAMYGVSGGVRLFREITSQYKYLTTMLYT